MNDILKYFKDLWSFFWTPAKTQEDRLLKRYDMLIALGVVFMIVYSTHFLLNFQNSDVMIKPSIVNIGTTNIQYNPAAYNRTIYRTTNMISPTIIATNMVLRPDEFYVGEIIGVKYFGIFGVVVEKIISPTGYTYEVRWKDNSHDLPKEIFYPWELYRPEAGTVPISALQN
jgi:hypothetical protein